jgi:hypothetical protein
MPRIWEQHIAQHDLYFHYIFPTQMIQRRPSVWFAASEATATPFKKSRRFIGRPIPNA